MTIAPTEAVADRAAEERAQRRGNEEHEQQSCAVATDRWNCSIR